MLNLDKSNVIANNTNNEKYPKKCWSVMFLKFKIITLLDFCFLFVISNLTPTIPKIITPIKTIKTRIIHSIISIHWCMYDNGCKKHKKQKCWLGNDWFCNPYVWYGIDV